MAMTGIYGEPLELIQAVLQSCDAFAAISPTQTVHLYQWIGSDTPMEVGDGWAVLRWKEDGHSIGEIGGLQVERIVEVTLARGIEKYTKAAAEAILSDAGAVVSAILKDDLVRDLIEKIILHTVGVDETTEPRSIGAVVHIHMGI